jgi:hypothetical protein
VLEDTIVNEGFACLTLSPPDGASLDWRSIWPCSYGFGVDLSMTGGDCGGFAFLVLLYRELAWLTELQ